MSLTSSQKLMEITKKIEQDMGIKFCTQCNLTKPTAGGRIFTLSNGRTRWKCATCFKKLRPPGFKNL
jgi:hypothetical protein